MTDANAADSNADDGITEAIPEGSPFERSHFKRDDESGDALFYSEARLVTHVDDEAIEALGLHYRKSLPEGGAWLDLMSSWISHYPEGMESGRVSGLGMNAEELAANPRLDDYVVHDLNADPILPYEAASFDAITVAVSVQYLQRPVPVFQEISRVLKPGGICMVSFSNRCFPTKAIRLWLGTDEATHIQIVGAYFHFADGFTSPQAIDISPNPGETDPMTVVQARRLEADADSD